MLEKSNRTETVRLLKEYPVLRATAENLQQQLAYKKATGAARSETDRLCQSLTQIRLLTDQLERGLSVLTEEERLILDMMYINPVRGVTMALCEKLEVELSTVYRRRNKAIEKLNRTMINGQ